MEFPSSYLYPSASNLGAFNVSSGLSGGPRFADVVGFGDFTEGGAHATYDVSSSLVSGRWGDEAERHLSSSARWYRASNASPDVGLSTSPQQHIPHVTSGASSVSSTSTSPYSVPSMAEKPLSFSSHTSIRPPRPNYIFTTGRTDGALTGPPPQLSQSALTTLTCPECSYRTRSNRPSDLKRHFDSHYLRKDLKHVCCGVRVDRVEEYGVGDLCHVYEHNGEVRVGRCWRVFARRDALLRHLRHSNTCICDVLPSAEYRP